MSLQVGSQGTAVAALTDNHGNPLSTLPTGATAAWTSSHPEIATVEASGHPSNPLQATVTAIAPGTATLVCAVANSAAAGGTTVSGSADEPVTAPPPATIASVTVTAP